MSEEQGAAAVAALDGDRVRLLVAGQEAASGVVDGTGDAWARRLAAALTPLRDATPDARGGVLPGAARLVDLLDLSPDDADAFVERWGRAGPERSMDLEVTVGSAGDGDFRIDLRRDGPHALVAGTTGSGKSEFLRTLVASLATSCSPADLTR